MPHPSLQSRVLYTEPIRWREFLFIQDDNFKDLSPEARNKLRASVLENNFTQPFYVWAEPGTDDIYCLDGKHRTMILEELEAAGYDIPEELPATFIDCKDKKEAAKLVLTYSSIYARITQGGFADFIEKYELQMTDILPTIDFPGIDMDKIVGDTGADFSRFNEELSTDEFKDEVTLKLTYPKADYLQIKSRMDQLMDEFNIKRSELLFYKLIFPNGPFYIPMEAR